MKDTDIVVSHESVVQLEANLRNILAVALHRHNLAGMTEDITDALGAVITWRNHGMPQPQPQEADGFIKLQEDYIKCLQTLMEERQKNFENSLDKR